MKSAEYRSMNWIRRNGSAAQGTGVAFTIVDIHIPANMVLEIYGWTVMSGTASAYIDFHCHKEVATGPVVFETYLSNGRQVSLKRPIILKGGNHYFFRAGHIAGQDSVLAATIFGRLVSSDDIDVDTE